MIKSYTDSEPYSEIIKKSNFDFFTKNCDLGTPREDHRDKCFDPKMADYTSVTMLDQ